MYEPGLQINRYMTEPDNCEVHDKVKVYLFMRMFTNVVLIQIIL